MAAQRQDSLCWDQYWLSGRQSCCDEHPDSHHAPIVRACWDEFFSDLEAGRVILDLCTGNGAVAAHAIAAASRAGVAVQTIGVDFADISPQIDPGGSAVHFVRASALALPFADGSVDLLTSQFGVEYVPRKRLAAEVMRVVKPGGRARFISHAADGVTVRNARAELADIAELLDDVRIFAAAKDALARVSAVERDAAAGTEAVHAAKRAHDLFQSQLRKLSDTWQRRAASAVFRDTGSVLQHTYAHRSAFPLETLLQKVAESEHSVLMHRDRLEDLCAAALDEPDCGEIAALYRSLGAAHAGFASVTAANGEDRIAWAISLTL